MAAARSSTVRSSCVGPSPPETTQRSASSASPKRGGEKLRVVPDEEEPLRLEPGAGELAREKRAVRVRLRAAHELAAREDDDGARALARPAAQAWALTPLAVTTTTGSERGKSRIRLPFTDMFRFSPVAIWTQSLPARRSARSRPRKIVPAKSSSPFGAPVRTETQQSPRAAVTVSLAGRAAERLSGGRR